MFLLVSNKKKQTGINLKVNLLPHRTAKHRNYVNFRDSSTRTLASVLATLLTFFSSKCQLYFQTDSPLGHSHGEFYVST